MALTYRTSAAGGGTSGTGNRTATITPAVGDLLLVFCGASGCGTNSPGGVPCTDNNGSGTYDPIPTTASLEFWPGKQSDVDTLYCFVRTALMANTTSTVVTVATGSNTAGEIVIVAISGASVAGSAAVRQWAKQANQAASTTPAPVFPSSCLTGNLTVGAIFNTSNPATLTPPTNWTERQDVGQSTPNTGLEVVSRDSGFTGTTVTWGGTSASAFCALMVEMDGGSAGAAIAAAVSGAGTVACALSTSITPAASINGVGSTSLALTTSIPLAAGISGAGTVTGALSTSIRLAAAISGVGSTAGALSTSITPAAAISGVGSVSLALTTSIPLAAAISGAGSATCALSIAGQIAHAYTVTGVEDSGGLSASKTTGSFTSQVGDCVVVVAAIYKNGPHAWHATTPIDDSYGNTWVPIGSEFNPGGGNQIVRKYRSILTAAGAGHTISIYADSATQFVMMVEAFRSTDSVTFLDGTPVDTAITSNGTAFAPSSGVTTSNPGSVVIGWIVTNNSVSLTADSPQTKGSFVSGTGWYGGGISYDIKTATGTYTPSWTLGSADQGTVGTFAILPAPSAISLAGACSGAASTTGNLSTQITPAAAISGVGSTSLALSTSITLAAAISGVGSDTANLSTQITPAAAISGVGSVTCDLTAPTGIALAGSVSGSGAVSAALTTAITPAAAISGVGTVAGALSTSITPAASISGVGSVAADLSTSITPAAAISGVGSATCALTTQITPAASISGAGSVTGALSTQITPAASITGIGSVTCALSVGMQLDGHLSGTGSVTCALTTSIPLAGACSGGASTTGALSTAIVCAGSLTGVGSTTGALSTQITLTTAISGSGISTLALTTSIPLAGTGAGIGLATCTLTTQISLAGGATGVGTVSGDFAVTVLALDGALVGVGTATCDLTMIPIPSLPHHALFTGHRVDRFYGRPEPRHRR